MRYLLACGMAIMGTSACSDVVPSDRERRWAAARLAEVPGVSESRVWCNDDVGATSDLCGEVRLADGSYLMFFSVGYRAIGEDADRVQAISSRSSRSAARVGRPSTRRDV